MSRTSGNLRAVANPQSKDNNNLIISQAGVLGSNSNPPADALALKGAANSTTSILGTITNASLGQNTTFTLQDPGVSAVNIVTAPASSSVVLTSTVTMTAAQVIAAYATPVSLVTAPGSGLCVMVTGAYVSTTVSTAFTTITGPIIQYGSTVHGGGTLATASGLVAGDITAATTQTRNLFPLATNALTGLSNLGLYFSSTAAAAVGTGSTVSITVNYVIISSSN